MGGLTIILWAVRFFLFNLYESPKFLMGRGLDAEAIEVLEKVATFNGSKNHLTLEQLRKTGVIAGTEAEIERGDTVDGTIADAIRKNLELLKGDHVNSLFGTRKLALSTSLLIILWAFIGLAFPLYNAFVPFFIQNRGTDFGDGSVNITYRNVSVSVSFQGDLLLTSHSPFIAGDSLGNRCPRCFTCRMDGGASIPWPQRNPLRLNQ